jgi:GAF domain-containing protein
LAAGEEFVNIADLAATEAYRSGDRHRKMTVDAGGARSQLGVPIRRDDKLLGAFIIYRTEVRPFTDKQTALLQNFAAQAIIAIENARLFDELRARTAELGRSVDELQLLNEVGQAVSSTLDLRRVLSTVLSRSVAITGADAGAVFRYGRPERTFRLVEAVGFDEALLHSVSDLDVAESESAWGRRRQRARRSSSPTLPLGRATRCATPALAPAFAAPWWCRWSDPSGSSARSYCSAARSANSQPRRCG